jgi:hypothetical protein
MIDEATLRPVRDDGLVELLNEKERAGSKAALYNKLAKSPDGKFLCSELQAWLDSVRDMYQHIDPTAPEAHTYLAMCQTSEHNLKTLIQRITDVGMALECLTAEKVAIQQEMRRRSDAANKTGDFVVAKQEIASP